VGGPRKCDGWKCFHLISKAQQVTGVLDTKDAAWKEIREWVDAAYVAHTIRHTRLGLMGHYYNGMLDVATDITRICIVFGSHIELLEVDELSALRQAVTEQEIECELATLARVFEVQPDCDANEMRRAARTAKALDRFVELHDLHALAYYYKGSGSVANEDTMSSIILGTSLLTARSIPVAGEYEVKNSLAMKLLDSFGAGGSFTEYYAVDFAADAILMGHDGPGHLAIAEGKAKVRPLEVYHGKVGKGVSIEMSVKRGLVTLLSVVEDEQKGR
jgi:L-arabinose isomerase